MWEGPEELPRIWKMKGKDCFAQSILKIHIFLKYVILLMYTLKCLQKCELSEELCLKAFFRYQGSWKPCNHIFIHWSPYIPTYKYHTFLTLKSTWRQKKPAQTAKFMGSSWVLSATGGTHVGPMNLAIRVIKQKLRAAIKFFFSLR